ncbi:pectate lyase [Polaribacter reichenbachii]|uniref:Pectinesterase n=1 Tax=Polaribacter reichenbachii TaxID=996801 RepID=A0A1B8TV97_9FLAO|nr:pectate lyase [Polaribacter reichenbachii]APZ45400.1 pectate lyase [Polaribacter reichenbachii]AUC19261.1 pectate lyase [Polaribacter reichenbachii]OBY63583.1 pectate lyase [Polaribacter reichenbachii]
MKTQKILFFLSAIILFSIHMNAQVHNKSWRDITNKKEGVWFASSEAKQIAENVLLYQRKIGGWPKNVQMHQPLSESKKQKLKAIKSSTKNVTTDNGATYQEMLFLSKVYRQQPDERFKNAFLKGVNYLLEAQYENGGWPQFYPLRKGYYTHITYNDDSMVNILNLLKELKDNTNYYSITPSDDVLKKIEIAFKKGIDCILKTQYKQNGVLTSWCAQHNENTLEPAKARAYELPSLSGAESAHIVLLLMSIENPSKEIINAINSAVTWFDKVKITGLRKDRVYNSVGKTINKRMIPDETAPAIWARFMNLEDNKPFFCDRDGIKKATLAEIGEERRNGYAWYKNDPQLVLDAYPKWKKDNDSKVVKKPKNPFKIVVAKDGSGDYSSIQEAINGAKSFPYDKITIFIKNGVYYEKVKIHEWNSNISLVGESKENTIITYDDYFSKLGLGRNSTFYTYTLLVEANNVILKNLTIKNSSGEVGQAVALSIFSDEVAVVNCKLLGNQDTLYASGKGKQYYKDSYIEGTTDFIFGSATAYFENCQIHSKKDSYITAASTPKDSLFGYVFKNCKLTAEKEVSKVYLGRPWRIYAQTVFINCDLGSHILPEGWHNWKKSEAKKTTFYAEYNNKGEGFRPEERVQWSLQLNKRQAKKYTLKNILGKYKTSKKEWYEEL